VPLDLETMHRIHFLQRWFELSDLDAEDAIYDSDLVWRFVGIELGENRVPEDHSILRFRYSIEEHDLATSIFAEVGALPDEKGLLLKQGTFVDAKTVSAPSAAKIRSGFRNPEMRHPKKGQRVVLWHEGARPHGQTGTAAQDRP